MFAMSSAHSVSNWESAHQAGHAQLVLQESTNRPMAARCVGCVRLGVSQHKRELQLCSNVFVQQATMGSLGSTVCCANPGIGVSVGSRSSALLEPLHLLVPCRSSIVRAQMDTLGCLGPRARSALLACTVQEASRAHAQVSQRHHSAVLDLRTANATKDSKAQMEDHV
eukprot:2144810-Rhodomonas_salina.1